MELLNEFWMDTNRVPACNDGEFDTNAMSLDSGYDFDFDLDFLDVKIDDECFRSIMNAVEDFDCQSLESSMSSDASNISLSGSPSPPMRTQETSKTPYSDATQCRRPSNNGHIRRPMNPFMVFAKEERKRMSALTPNLHNAEISKICGKKWKDMTSEEKRPFEVESARLKLLHEKEYPDYKYRPKKKSKHVVKKRSEKSATKRSLKMKVKIESEQPLENKSPAASGTNGKPSYLMVNGQKIPLNTGKSPDNKNAFNLQLKIDENYKIVPATASSTCASPILQILPRVAGGAMNGGVQIKQESKPMSPVFVSFPGAARDASFSPLLVAGESDKSDLNNGLYLLIQCNNSVEAL